MSRRRRSSRRTQRSASTGIYELSVSARRLPRALLGIALFLLACHALQALVHYRVHELPWVLRQLFDVDQENNLPTWYSAFLLLLASALLWVCGRHKAAAGERWSGSWTALAVGFLLLSADEVAGVHESINTVIVMTWAIPAGIIALLIGLGFIPFLRSLPRPIALRFGLAGAVYLGGAAGLEILGNAMVGDRLRQTLIYNMETLAEEGLEMGGVIFFIHALLAYMRSPGSGEVRTNVQVA